LEATLSSHSPLFPSSSSSSSFYLNMPLSVSLSEQTLKVQLLLVGGWSLAP
jgi:hypothetical protein